MTFLSYHVEFPPSQDMTCGAGSFTGSKRSFKTLRSISESPSGYIDKQSYGRGNEGEGVGMYSEKMETERLWYP